MFKYVDQKIVISAIVAAIAVPVIATLASRFIPSTVPGAGVVKDALAAAAS